jgi:hypothetical protein
MPATATKRQRRTSAEREAMQNEALDRATNGRVNLNYATIIREFSARGIAPDDIVPRFNVLTYHAWRACGRQVRKGEKGVHVITYVPCDRKEKDKKTGEEKIVTSSRPTSATVFHVSQTKEIAHPTHCRCADCAMPGALTSADAIKRAKEESQRIEYPDHVPLDLNRPRDSV